MKTIKTIGATLALVFLAGLGFVFSGIYDVSASSPHSGIVDWLLSATSHASIERRAADIDVPDLGDDALALAGIGDFDSMCVACHGAPGREPDAMGQGLNPPAPDLAEEAEEMSPAELFWVTKHGIKMTGMPAWGNTHDDDALWSVVAFMTRLPDLDADGYQAMLASAGGMGHHEPAPEPASDMPDDGHEGYEH